MGAPAHFPACLAEVCCSGGKLKRNLPSCRTFHYWSPLYVCMTGLSLETRMKKHVLAITISSLILLPGITTVSAQQGPVNPTMQQPDQQQAQTHQHRYDEEGRDTGTMGRDPSDEDDWGRMMGQGRRMGMGHGMMGYGGMMHRGMMGQRGGMPLMRIIFALMDADGDGTISLQEFQAAHEKIFKAMDVDKDGTVSFEEMMNFMHGSRQPHRSPSAR
jgi:hypothetical protein